jgi:hypothetical protein
MIEIKFVPCSPIHWSASINVPKRIMRRALVFVSTMSVGNDSIEDIVIDAEERRIGNELTITIVGELHGA